MNGLHILAALAAGGFYITGEFLKIEDCVRTGEIIFFLGIISFIIHFNQHNFYKYINQSERISNFPMGEIRLKNNLFLAAFLVIAVGIMLLLPIFPLREITDMIRDVLYSAVSAISRFLLNHFKAEESHYRPKEESHDVGKNYQGRWESKNSTPDISNWGVVGAFVLKIVVFVCIVALFIYIIFLLYKKITTKRKKNNIEVREFILPQMVRERTKKKEGGGRLFWDRSPNGKMRRLYMQRVKKAGNKGSGIPKTLTPSEIEEFAGISGTYGIEELHKGYEKARYSREGCSDGEVRSLKINFKK